MTDKEILEKALKKAHEHGYKCWIGYILEIDYDRFYSKKDYNGCCYDGISGHINEIIFSHEFAKVFWKEETTLLATIDSNGNYEEYLKPWQFHLQQMILEKEPLKYIEKFL